MPVPEEPATLKTIAAMSKKATTDRLDLLVALTGPHGRNAPADVCAAAQQLAELQAQRHAMAFAVPAIRTTMQAWRSYAAGPGMWSDNYDEAEQEREVYGPAILQTLLTILLRHAIQENHRAFITELLSSFSGLLNLFYTILHDMLPMPQDLSLLLSTVVAYTCMDMNRSGQPDATIYDCLCAIQNLSYAMPRHPAATYTHLYPRLILDELQCIRLSNARRPYLRMYLGKVKATYTSML